MSRFNVTSVSTTKTTNFAGGAAYSQSPELELVSILLTSFAKDQFYREANDTFDQLKALISRFDKKFVAQAIIYARTKFGMRSITHVAASELAKYIGGKEWAKRFFEGVIYRPDDMAELLVYHTTHNGKVTPAMKKGLALSFNKFTTHTLAKYRLENKDFSLIDVVRIVHPKPIEQNKEGLTALIKGILRSSHTWESELTRAGQKSTNKEEKDEFKKEVWAILIKEKRMGYFALLRNLRNILEQAPELLPEALELLTTERLIKNSLVLPFRFVTAFDEIKTNTSAEARLIMSAISKAIDIALSNVPKFEGRTLVVLDVSGSMSGQPMRIGSLFAAVLAKSNNADLITFDNYARYNQVNIQDTTLTIAENIDFEGGGTDFHSIFKTANRPYDRIIILSDMQGWIGYHAPTQAFNEYKQRTGANPYIYSFDLTGYGSMQFPEQRVFALAGFSEKIFSIMKLMESDKKALVNEIKKIEL